MTAPVNDELLVGKAMTPIMLTVFSLGTAVFWPFWDCLSHNQSSSETSRVTHSILKPTILTV